MLVFYTICFCSVHAAIKITTIQSPLHFKDAAAGVASETVLATDTANAAQFQAYEPPNGCTSVNFTLPSVPFNMTNGSNTIVVTAVSQNPANPVPIVGGVANVWIGGTRDAMPSSLVTGTYSGSFSVRVRCSSGGAQPSSSANAEVIGIRSLAIASTSDLQFSGAYRGQVAETIAPANGGAFSVSGEGGHVYNITFGASSITMTYNGAGSGGDTNKEIMVDSFTSSPSGSGLLSGSTGSAGTQTLQAGARRAAILTTQQPGNYSGSYTITVTYQ